MYLLDTNAVIDYCNDKLPIAAANFIETIEPKISVITAIELFAFAAITKTEQQKLEEFIDFITIYDNISLNIRTHTVNIRKVYRLKLPDALIAATSLAYGLILISRNIKDFENISGLQVIDPYNL